MNGGNERSGRLVWTLAVIGVLLIVVLIAVFAARRTGLIIFEPVTAGEFSQRLSGLLLVALFIERFLEVLISGSRGPEESRLRRQVKKFEDELGATPGSPPVSSPPAPTPELELAREELAKYKGKTRRIAFAISVVLGVAVAALGIRALGLFIDVPEFMDLAEVQRRWFHVLDILLTGGVLAGGSDGLHQLMETFTGYLEKAKEAQKNGGGG